MAAARILIDSPKQRDQRHKLDRWTASQFVFIFRPKTCDVRLHLGQNVDYKWNMPVEHLQHKRSERSTEKRTGA